MRALGPGSVSSILKTILDVVNFVLWIGIGGASLAIIALLLVSFDPKLLGGHVLFDGLRIQGPWLGPLAAAMVVAIDLYLGGAMVIVRNLRSIFASLIAGDPFHPANIGRLRMIGGALAVLEVGRYVAAALAHMMFRGAVHIGGGVDLTTWFAVLSIFALAEVFREGARLRGEAELTI